MTGHAAFPNPKDRKRIAQHFRSVKKDVADSTANQHPKERSPGYEIADPLRWQIAITTFREPAHDEIGGNKRQNVGESIPTRTDVVPKPENKGIEIIDEIRQHCGESSPSS